MGKAEWHTVGGSGMYSEKTFPNRKVGHAMAHVKSLWQARLDGIYLGSAATCEDAQALVEWEYEQKYGG